MFNFLKKFFRPPRKPLASFGRTDTGRVRDHNEDAYCILANRRIFLVADGMGGHNAGEVASRVALETLTDYFSNRSDQSLYGNNEEIRHALISSVREANDKVMKLAATDEDLLGMGCTLVSCFIDADTIHTCHVGDARCYAANEHQLFQITTDHSYQAKYDEILNSDQTVEIKKLPPRHVVTQAIGFPFNEDPEYTRRKIKSKDRILLCTDGLWSMVEHDEIHQILKNSDTPEIASNILVDRANEAGGKDNITAVVIFVS